MKDFNVTHGIEGRSCAPYSQWQDPAERAIQSVMNCARTSMMHGGAKKWMWGWAVQHACDSINRLRPPGSVPGPHDKSRLRLLRPEVLESSEMRTQKPFLCLAFKMVPLVMRSADFEQRANPCIYLQYVSLKKSYALLTIPDLSLTWSVQCDFKTMVFPLRATDRLSSQLDIFMRPSAQSVAYSDIHGPGNLMRRHHHPRASDRDEEADGFFQEDPTEVRQPVATTAIPGPAVSSSRGYNPSAEGLNSLAQQIATVSSARLYSADELAARTPRNGPHALAGPDSEYWLPAMLTDFRIIRDNSNIVNITDVKPAGSVPAMEQRPKIKYREAKPIALPDLPPKAWKMRTIMRGDRCVQGVHYDKTEAPVAANPTTKVTIAWGVAKGLLPYQFDQSFAFYTNKMDREGVHVKLPPGYDPEHDRLRPMHLPPLYGELAAGVPGIPQGSLIHYNGLVKSLTRMQFSPCAVDGCLFIHSTKDMAVTCHTDDGILFAPSHAHAEWFFGPEGLGSDRVMTWGALENTLGIEFTVNYTSERRSIFMCQSAYASIVLDRAGMKNARPAITPAVAGRTYTRADCPTTDEQKADLAARGKTQALYHTVQASLNFLTNTRDDLRFINGKNAKYVGNPGDEHHKSQAHELRFVAGTAHYGIEFEWNAADPESTDGPLTIEAWSDSSFADDVDTGRTTLGSVIKVNGATVCAASNCAWDASRLVREPQRAARI